MAVRLYDAHNHLQDERLASRSEIVWADLLSEGITRLVVNGSCEDDWPAVLALAEQHPQIVPAFGYHPWYIQERTAHWKEALLGFLDRTNGAVGEIGLDRWIPDHDLAVQEEVFVWQWRLAVERDCPVTIHCLRAWGRLLEILQREPRSPRGFLLHSYGGSAELIPSLVELGGYFSISGYFAHERKLRQRQAFLQVPWERLLIETDAPDMWPPPAWNRYPLLDPKTQQPINHPANLGAVYQFTAELRGVSLENLATRVEENFQRLFEHPPPRPSPR